LIDNIHQIYNQKAIPTKKPARKKILWEW